MKFKKIVSKIAIFAIPFLFGFASYQIMALSGIKNIEWLALLIGIMCQFFTIEAVKTWNKQEITWSYLTVQDKSAITISLIVQLISFLYPVKEKMGIVVILLSLLISSSLSWALIRIVGSDELKKRYFLLKQIEEREISN